MRKRIFLAVLMIAALVLSTSCSLVEKDAAVDAQTVIVEVAGQTFTKSQVQTATQNTLDYQSYMYSMYGMSYDPTDAKTIASAQDSAIQVLVQQAVIEQKEKELGLSDFTDDEVKSMQATVDQSYNSNVDTVKNQYFKDTTLTGDDLQKAVEAKMTELGYPDKDSLMATQKITQAEQKLKDYVVKDVTVTDDEVKTEYDSKLAAAQSGYASNLSQFGSDVSNGSTIYYRPAGYRYVKNLLVKISDDESTKISDLQSKLTSKQSDLSTNATSIAALPADASTDSVDQAKSRESLTANKAQLETDVADLQKQLTAAQDTAYAAIQPKIDEIETKLAAGTDFDQLLADYGEDTGMQSEPAKTNGYPVCAGDTNYVSEFTEAAMTLVKVGDVSKPFRTKFGIHIVKYASDITEGAVPLDEIKDTVKANVLKTKQDDLYQSTVTQWVKEANAKIYKDRMN